MTLAPVAVAKNTKTVVEKINDKGCVKMLEDFKIPLQSLSEKLIEMGNSL